MFPRGLHTTITDYGFLVYKCFHYFDHLGGTKLFYKYERHF